MSLINTATGLDMTFLFQRFVFLKLDSLSDNENFFVFHVSNFALNVVLYFSLWIFLNFIVFKNKRARQFFFWQLKVERCLVVSRLEHITGYIINFFFEINKLGWLFFSVVVLCNSSCCFFTFTFCVHFSPESCERNLFGAFYLNLNIFHFLRVIYFEEYIASDNSTGWIVWVFGLNLDRSFFVETFFFREDCLSLNHGS